MRESPQQVAEESCWYRGLRFLRANTCPPYSTTMPSVGMQLSTSTKASHGARMRPVYIGQVLWWSQCGRILRGRMWIQQERVDEKGL